MNVTTGILSSMILAIALGAGTALAQDLGPTTDTPTKDKDKSKDKEDKSGKKAKIGEKAPDFTLKDVNGKPYRLADYSGKIVVLQWINPDCPVCRRVHKDKLVEQMLEELKDLDNEIVHLAINSTHYMDAKKTAAYLEEQKVKSPALIDQDGKVGRLYGAKTTPHMFVIDKEGILRYDGAFDNDGRGRLGDDRKNYVVNAVELIVDGETVMPDTTRPYGCNVKYKEPAKRSRDDRS